MKLLSISAALALAVAPAAAKAQDLQELAAAAPSAAPRAARAPWVIAQADRPAATAAPAVQPAGPVTGLRLMPDTPQGHGAPPLAGNAFVETQRNLYLLLTFTPAVSGQSFMLRVRTVNTTASNVAVLVQGEAAVTPSGLIPVHLTRQQNWPVGDYAVIVEQAGREVARLPFSVQPAAPRNGPITVSGVTAGRAAAAGAFEPAPQLRSADRRIRFQVSTQGARTDGARLTWVFTAVETTAGAREVTRDDIPRQFLEDTLLDCVVSLPRDWPVGRYRLDLLIDGAPALSHNVAIGP